MPASAFLDYVGPKVSGHAFACSHTDIAPFCRGFLFFGSGRPFHYADIVPAVDFLLGHKGNLHPAFLPWDGAYYRVYGSAFQFDRVCRRSAPGHRDALIGLPLTLGDGGAFRGFAQNSNLILLAER